MNENNEINYGPLQALIGTWKGNKGIDIAPEPDGIENNPYYESITFSPIGDVTNAEEQIITALHYRQIVQRKSTDKIFHDETGYWMWDAAAKIIMHSLTIPRAVSVLAGGNHSGKKESNGDIKLNVSADINSPDWQIIQSPFMRDKAKTTEFHHEININGNQLNYSQTTIVDIYGKVFEHTDENELIRQ